MTVGDISVMHCNLYYFTNRNQSKDFSRWKCINGSKCERIKEIVTKFLQGGEVTKATLGGLAI